MTVPICRSLGQSDAGSRPIRTSLVALRSLDAKKKYCGRHPTMVDLKWQLAAWILAQGRWRSNSVAGVSVFSISSEPEKNFVEVGRRRSRGAVLAKLVEWRRRGTSIA